MTAMTLKVGSWPLYCKLGQMFLSCEGSDNDLGRRALVTIERTDPSRSEYKRDCNQTLLVFTPSKHNGRPR